MKRSLIILPLLFWFGCQDESASESNNLKGIWEMDSLYFYLDSTFLAVDDIFYYVELEEDFRERYVSYEGTDSACFEEWSTEQIFQLFDPDSGTVLYLGGGGVLRIGFKVKNERISMKIDGQGVVAKGIKSNTSDFTPLCEY